MKLEKCIIFQDGEYIFVQMENQAKIWDHNDSFNVKRAGSILVIKDKEVIKNIVKDFIPKDV